MKTQLLSLSAWSLAALLLLAASPLSAQDDTPPPGPPVLAPLTGEFSLVKKYTYVTPPDAPQLTPDQQAAENFLHPAATKPTEVDAVSKGGIRHDIVHNSDGSSQEIWHVQKFRITIYSAHPTSLIVNELGDTSNPNAPNQYRDASDFAELAWLPKASYSGVQMSGDTKCYVYKSEDQTLLIDAATHRPIYYASKTLQVTYTWSAPPDTAPQLPPGATQRIAQFQHPL